MKNIQPGYSTGASISRRSKSKKSAKKYGAWRTEIMGVPQRYIDACNYPGLLDANVVEQQLTIYVRALGVTRQIRQLQAGWCLDDEPALSKNVNMILDDLCHRNPNARAARDARDARDARAARAARAALGAFDAPEDPAAPYARAARAARDPPAARAALDARAARDALDALDARAARAAFDARDALDA